MFRLQNNRTKEIIFSLPTKMLTISQTKPLILLRVPVININHSNYLLPEFKMVVISIILLVDKSLREWLWQVVTWMRSILDIKNLVALKKAIYLLISSTIQRNLIGLSDKSKVPLSNPFITTPKAIKKNRQLTIPLEDQEGTNLKKREISKYLSLRKNKVLSRWVWIEDPLICKKTILL